MSRDGKPFVFIKDSDSDQLLTQFSFYPTGQTPVAITTVDDVATSSSLAVMVVNNTTGNINVRIKDSVTKANLNTIWIGGANFTAKGIAKIEDRNGDGVSELAVLLVINSTGKALVRIIDPITKARLDNVFFP